MTEVEVASEPAVGRTDGYLPIEQYAAIGDGRTLALVGSDGAIDWMCLPNLDSPSVFGAVLDSARGGCFGLSPVAPFTVSRRYVERTNVLETTFHTADGVARVTDALTIDDSQRAPWRELVRRIEGVSGNVPMHWRYEPRFGFGQRPARLERHGPAFLARDRELALCLRVWDAGDPHVSAEAIDGEFELDAGEQAMLVLIAAESQPLPIPQRRAVERRFEDTLHVWRSWISRQGYDGPWRDAVERSLLAIRLLADGRTGAIAAAGTTSLPEVIGGQRNYDYRFGWVRDLCFTLDALIPVGMEQVTHAGVTWLLKATEHTHPRIDPVYALAGDVVRSQCELPLPGYRGTGPAHEGNKAGSQLQLGGFGDLLETLSAYVDDGHILTPSIGERLADVGDLLAHIWRNEDAGLWELGQSAHYGTSKLGCWVAFDRLLKLAEGGHIPARHINLWKRERDAVHRFIENHLFSPERNAYLFKAGSQELDCGLLLAARRGFGDRARVIGTIDAIRAELHAEGPLFYRYSGMREEENAFLACSFWMVEAMAIAGRGEEASELMDAIVGRANDVGLYSEEMEPGSCAMRGNFPQALTHLGLISAACVLQGSNPTQVDRPEAG
jgi:GH15 family glucan-1,4-alpha-glucosidase